jgi:hypothetical protein
MSRNGSGTFNLTAGNPVVSGTTISSTWANTTLSDIANGLTQSVSADGQTPITGALQMNGNDIQNAGTITATSGVFTNVTDSSLTTGRVTYASTSGLLTDSAKFLFDGTNLGVGMTPTNFGNGYTVLQVGNTSTGGMVYLTNTSNAGGRIYGNSAGLTYDAFSTTYHAFNINGTEQMRIDSNGSLLVGSTDGTKSALLVYKVAPNSAYGQICAFSPTAGDSNISGMSIVKYANDSTTAQVLIRFLMNQGNTGQGQINANGANAAAFGSYSDSRLKENISDLPPQLSNICSLRPVEFDYIKSEGGGHQIGFIAQEVKEIYPDLVGEREDGMFTLTDMSKNDARLIKAIQELNAKVTALEAQLGAK